MSKHNNQPISIVIQYTYTVFSRINYNFFRGRITAVFIKSALNFIYLSFTAGDYWYLICICFLQFLQRKPFCKECLSLLCTHERKMCTSGSMII